jgi:hypothetical protein
MKQSELRKENENYEKNASNLIEDSLEFDQKTAWSLINCRRSRKSNAVILKTNGNLLTDPNDVCNECAKHFEQIARIPNDAPDLYASYSVLGLLPPLCKGIIILAFHTVGATHLSKIILNKLHKCFSNSLPPYFKV